MLEKDLKKVTDGVYPFHMPGHKRQREWTEGLLDLDLTEICGTDDLHDPEGIIKDAQLRGAQLCKTVSTIFLSGGATCGILAAISALCRRGDKIIVARNCHKSVYNACLINGLDTTFVYPTIKPRLGTFGEVLPSSIAAAMEESGAKVVVITSPTYEGILSDVKTIAQIVHKNKGILVVDSAHGAHLGWSDYFPKSARTLGADLVIESGHKTLPCLTGAAMLQVCSHRVSYSALQAQLGIFETSSPPYPIICSIDRVYGKIKEEDIFTPFAKRLDHFYEQAQYLTHLSLFQSGDFDRSKLVISCADADVSGFELKRILREEFNIELEMAMPAYALAMTSPADTDEGFEALLFALLKIDGRLNKKASGLTPPPPTPEKRLAPHEATDPDFGNRDEAEGKISAEYICAYPPGSPVIIPGEVLSGEVLSYLDNLYASGAQIKSSLGKYPENIAFLKEKD